MQDVPSIEELVDRMSQGDREAAALFVVRYGSRIRRRVRGMLSPSMRRLVDSQDILSTVGRRLDLYVRDGKLSTDPRGLWSLVTKMASRAVMTKGRLVQRLKTVEGEDSVFARDMLKKLQQYGAATTDPDIEIERAVKSLPSSIDRQILSMWLAETTFIDIARCLELSPAAVRMRWQRIKATLRERLAVEST